MLGTTFSRPICYCIDVDGPVFGRTREPVMVTPCHVDVARSKAVRRIRWNVGELCSWRRSNMGAYSLQSSRLIGQLIAATASAEASLFSAARLVNDVHCQRNARQMIR